MQPNMRATRVGDCMKRTTAVLTWASLLVILAAVHPAWCADKSTEKVRIAVSSKSLGFFDVWAARERGFYRKHGIEAEIIAMRPPLTIGAIQAGEIDYAFGAADDFVARLLVRRGGLDLRDVSFVNMGGSDTRFPALATGRIDATPLSLPFFVIAKRQGYNLLGSAADVIDMATVGIGTSTRKIQQEREQVKKMVRAQLDTLHWIKNQKTEVVPFLQKYFDLEPDVAAESHHIYSRLIVDDAKPLVEAIKTVLDQQGKPDLPLDRVVDSSIVEEVLRERR